MATKDERPGLLSKVAMFVRNPTKDWSELSRVETEPDSAYDKQALKAMIERKRQNDFVRKREFDQLRKLRNRDPSVTAGVARPSFFQTSIPTDPDGRAVTLKKIDEIEAQMSKQWWKGKQDAAAAQALGASAVPVVPAVAPGSVPTLGVAGDSTSPISLPSSFEATESAGLSVGTVAQSVGPVTEYAPTEMGNGVLPMSSHVPLGTSRAAAMPAIPKSVPGLESGELSFSTSKLFAMDVADMATDPELEEAAIRFANGDDAGAEAGLLHALQSAPADVEIAFNWAAALMDLYRATQNRVRFDAAVMDFVHIWNGRVPAWQPVSLDAQVMSDTTAAAPFLWDSAGVSAGQQTAIWNCPPVLRADDMEALRDVLSREPMPWVLSWDALREIDPQSMPLLAGLFASLCSEPVSLSFSGAQVLINTLRDITPSGDRSVDSSWWGVRLNVLRAMQLLDEFELVALDYCVTYEVSPPAWEPAQCTYSTWSAAAPSAKSADFSATVPIGLNSVTVSSQELRGEVLGDAADVLAAIDQASVVSDMVSVSCRYLVRVDFSAAGSILNWVAQKQAQGCTVQFQDVHRLVAAFFNVIGINEHARIVPRAF